MQQNFKKLTLNFHVFVFYSEASNIISGKSSNQVESEKDRTKREKKEKAAQEKKEKAEEKKRKEEEKLRKEEKKKREKDLRNFGVSQLMFCFIKEYRRLSFFYLFEK